MQNSLFKIGRGQAILVVLATSVLTALSISSFTSSDRALSAATQANSATTQSTAIIITQRETLVYTVRFSEWLRGDFARRDLQIARAILAQRLEVIDSTGQSIGSQARPTYLAALKASDQLVASAVPGRLPLALQRALQLKGEPLIETLITESHRMIDDYSRTVSLQIKGYAESQKTASNLNLYLLVVLVILMAILISWTALRVRSENRRNRMRNLAEEELLKEVREELGEAKQTVRALKTLNEAKNEFVSTINHELRTPLTSIIGYVEILKDFSSSEHNGVFHEYLDVVDKNATVLLDLVESILLLSSLESSENQRDFGECDLLQICQNSIALLKYNTELENISIYIERDSQEKYLIEGNKGQLSQVFTNLISNAVKFSPHGSTVVIKLKKVTDKELVDRVCVEVCDNGIGIPPDEIEQLFSRFFRASNASESQIPGSGLGLAITQKIVSLHFGEIDVKSVVGQGTIMTVTLPVLLSPVEKMVLERRQDVLERAIAAIVASPQEKLEETTHEFGGSIGFYTFLDEGNEVLEFSRWLRLNPEAAPREISERKETLIQLLRNTLSSIERKGVS